MNQDTTGYIAENLEKLILKKGTDEPHIRTFITELAISKVFVLLDRPWDGLSIPSHETRLLHVSDGTNVDQSMLAVFTSLQATEHFLNMPGNAFQYAVVVDAAWAFLGISENTGIMVNPNAATGSFRIGPAVARQLHNIAERHLKDRLAPHK